MPKSEIQYDDSQLQKLFGELEIKRRKQAIRGAFRTEGRRVLKIARGNFTGIRNSSEMAKSIRMKIWTKKAVGFKVTASGVYGKHGLKNGFYTNRFGKEKPLALFYEFGPSHRETRTESRVFRRARKGHPTGGIPKIGFIAKTRMEVGNSVEQNIQNELRQQVTKVSQKYGCK